MGVTSQTSWPQKFSLLLVLGVGWFGSGPKGTAVALRSDLQADGETVVLEEQPGLAVLSATTTGEKKSGKRLLGGYGQLTMKHLNRWWQLAVPWGDGPGVMKIFFWALLLTQLVGPFILYYVLRGVVLNSTAMVRQKSQFAQEIVDSLKGPLKLLSWLFCVDIGIILLTSGVEKEFPMLTHIQNAMNAFTALSILIMPVRILSLIDHAFEASATERLTSSSYLKRQERMNEISCPTNSVHSTHNIDEHGYYLFSYVWRPFYYTSLVILSIALLICMTGNSLTAYFLGVGYLFMTCTMAAFGARTLGPELFGGIVLFLEKPFVEGDIITLDKPAGGKGGAKTDVEESVVTGFVESIGVRSVIVRRFDMRAVTVPNSAFMKGAVANWNTRPRKLIHIDFAVSHRAPVELCSIFQEKVEFLVKNHVGVDPQQYIKARFRGLDAGLMFMLVCFNARGHKKQAVQQDLVFKIAVIAKNLGIHLVFQQSTVDNQVENVSSGENFDKDLSLTEEQQLSLSAKLDHVLPGKRDKLKPLPQYSPEGEVVIRLEKVILLQERKTNSFNAEALLGGQTRAYQIKLCPKQGGANAEILSRKFVPHVTADELRFHENVGLALAGEDQDAGTCADEPQTAQLHLLELRKGIESLVWNMPETIGSVTFDVLKLASETVNNQSAPHTLELQDANGQEVGILHLQVYVPESLQSALKAESEMPSTHTLSNELGAS
mmetsp:Transcript_82349/g.176344  ORF Transcript_82349/g.176344 Transcript_82349/m.176344 type:complete len:718 (+) Transcript_82349:68-2221(+)